MNLGIAILALGCILSGGCYRAIHPSIGALEAADKLNVASDGTATATGIVTENRKIAEVEKLLTAMTDFFHLGRHERGKPADVNHKDSELALVCASSLMGYFAKCKP
jgi:hypothetical protein